MKMVDLETQQGRIREALDQRLKSVLSHGQYIMGPEVKELEGLLAEFAGCRHAIGCSSGTDALLIALMAYGVGPGDAVVTSPFTFIATAEVIALLGATPVFADIDPRTFNIDAAKLEEVLKATDRAGKLKVKGLIPVDLFGLPADYDDIMAFANAHDLFVLQDGAQSFGARFHGKRSPALAHVGATSFFPAKPLGCYGDGGAIFTDDDEMAAAMRSIVLHGKGGHKYENVRIGVNGRLDTLQAAVLLPKLEIFEEELAHRQAVADQYGRALAQVVAVPHTPSGMVSAWAQYSILTDRRDELQQYLQQKGIPTAIYYPKPLHLQAAFGYLRYAEGDFPEAERASRRILSLPMHPYLADGEIGAVVAAVRGFCES
ncbi:DegT/DnrJ/EryC1/StrS family aminotransferase [Desulfatitalea alkaliphila]|uniref:DegT/DnrJ/EryC1/StrS family aminotransferase n=1 Tax=Desulfatitalea alkaliphila TaxID=2929485 RepID=A0AA41R7J0_9BACT|nr:DegT/DnrJ/EryC1/StrS family aminotransferase [Desulfatitalea alkaliphila]MCJ8502998.1 DegT/DnrJ/EryC1/StrS family aminotransferase [Desulfatitalea alkaliphila]